MQALIFAAGKGERMRPLTLDTPKALLQVHGKPLVEWQVEALARAGVTRIVVNLSWLGERIEAYLGDGARFGVELRYSAEGPEPLETGGGMRRALPLLDDAPFVAVNADVWSDVDYATLPRQPRGLAHLVLVPNPEHHRRGDFALDAAGRCRADGEPRHTFSGIGVYRPELLAGIDASTFKLGHVLREAMQLGEVSGQLHRGRWVDIGTPARLAAVNAEPRDPSLA